MTAICLLIWMVRRNTKEVIAKHSIRRHNQNNYSDTETRCLAQNLQHSTLERWRSVRIENIVNWATDLPDPQISVLYYILLQLAKRRGTWQANYIRTFCLASYAGVHYSGGEMLSHVWDTQTGFITIVFLLLLSLVGIIFYLLVLCQIHSPHSTTLVAATPCTINPKLTPPSTSWSGTILVRKQPFPGGNSDVTVVVFNHSCEI